MAVKSNLSLLSLIFGVAALLFIISGFSIPVGALSIVTGLLSRGNGPLDQRAKIGIAISLLAITIGICLIIWSFNAVTPEQLQELINQYQELGGA